MPILATSAGNAGLRNFKETFRYKGSKIIELDRKFFSEERVAGGGGEGVLMGQRRDGLKCSMYFERVTGKPSMLMVMKSARAKVS